MNPSLRRHEDGDHDRWVGFVLAQQSFALDIARVREVVPAARYDAVPGAPPLVLGVTNLRGRIVTVIDLHGRLQIRAGANANAEGQYCLIVVEAGGETLALRVDAIGELYTLARSAIKAAPTVAAPGSDGVVTGMVRRDQQLLTLLDLDALVAAVMPGRAH